MKNVRPNAGSLGEAVSRHALRAMAPLVLFLVCVLAPGGCRSGSSTPLAPPPGPGTCRLRTPSPTLAPPAGAMKTASAGTLPGSFSVTSTGEASYVIPLVTVPGRAGMEPRLAVVYDGAGDGVLGAGFSVAGLSAITRCPQTLAQDGEIREVRYDGQDKLCLDGKRLVPLGPAEAGILEFRTFPDTFAKILGHYPTGGSGAAMGAGGGTTAGGGPATALWFEIHMPSGLVIQYGGSASGLPRTSNGDLQAWLATQTQDGRGNAMTFGYCFEPSPDDPHTAEYALDEIRLSCRFDGCTRGTWKRATSGWQATGARSIGGRRAT